jgi:phage terminase large subunit
MTDNAFVEFLAEYADDPVNFCVEVLDFDPLPWQAEVMKLVASGERRISVRSGHGVGKSTAAAALMLWFLLTRYPVKIVVTAPTSAQLFDALFAEVKRRMKDMPDALKELIDATSDRVVLKASPTEAFISARTSSKERPESLAGVHSEHVLLVADEASGIPEEVFESAAGSMSTENACTLLLGNPVRTSGFFYKTQTQLTDSWKTMRVSCVDSPLVSDDFLRDMAQRYGELSNAYRVRVLGEFPTIDDESWISMGLVEEAMQRDIEPYSGSSVIYGLDVSRFGSDSSALVKRKGNVVFDIKTWRGLDLMELCGAVMAEIAAARFDEKPDQILVDSIGLGSGVVDRLRELGAPARGINVSESSAMKPEAMRLRDELWMLCREWLEDRDCKLPKNDKLASELTTPRYSYSSSGKIKLESKDEMRKRGHGSPDIADALCLTMAASSGSPSQMQAWQWTRPIEVDTGWVV